MDTGDPVNQSRLEQFTCSRQEIRENMCKQIMIGGESCARFQKHSLSTVMKNQRKGELSFPQSSENGSNNQNRPIF